MPEQLTVLTRSYQIRELEIQPMNIVKMFMILVTSYHHLTVPLLLTSSTGDDGDAQFSRTRDFDLIQSVPPMDLLNMKAPPHILTLTEQPLDSLETEPTATSQSNPSQVVRVQSRFSFCVLFISQYNKWNFLNLLNLTLIQIVVQHLYYPFAF